MIQPSKSNLQICC
ncbi:hypothetical protein LINGRAHAP2_LOCUS29095 [Linum grandiflorum]